MSRTSKKAHSRILTCHIGTQTLVSVAIAVAVVVAIASKFSLVCPCRRANTLGAVTDSADELVRPIAHHYS